MFIQKRIKMGGGGGGGGGGGPRGRVPCGEVHDNCRKPSKNSYCNKELLHPGSHKCRSCGESF